MKDALLLVAVLAIPLGWYVLSTYGRNAKLSLPPGPKPSFFWGNLHQLPRKSPWLTYMSWSKTYGPIFYFRVLARRTVVINSAKVALDLLERRSAIYSDRPLNWMGGELAGRKKNVFLVSTTDPRFKLYRKMLHAGLNARASYSYRPIQYEERTTLLKNLATNPDKFITYIRRNAAAVIMKVAYGYQVESDEDKFIKIIEEGGRVLEGLLIPGKFWIEFLPILRFVPSWFPGAGFKRLAREAKIRLSLIENEPFAWAEKQIASGNYIESFTSKLLYPDSEMRPDANEIDIIKWVSGGLYVGGAETSVSILTSFFFLMALHPEIQKTAQLEVAQVANGRLPTLDDHERMPYVRALIQEVLRWGPVSPFAIPHRLVEDDIYEGYRLPKGTRVVANIWAMTHDEEVYPDPSIFDPTRHLGDNPQADPLKYIFGFGRRACPGAHLAQMSLFLNISSILATFNILKPLNDLGHEYEPTAEFQSMAGLIHLKPFPCRIVPRSSDIIQTLQ